MTLIKMSLAIDKFVSILSYQIWTKSCKIHDYKFAFQGEHSVEIDLDRSQPKREKNLASEDIRHNLPKILHDSIDFQYCLKLYILALYGYRYSFA